MRHNVGLSLVHRPSWFALKGLQYLWCKWSPFLDCIGLTWLNGNVSIGRGGTELSNSARMHSPGPVTRGQDVYPSYCPSISSLPSITAVKFRLKMPNWAATAAAVLEVATLEQSPENANRRCWIIDRAGRWMQLLWMFHLEQKRSCIWHAARFCHSHRRILSCLPGVFPETRYFSVVERKWQSWDIVTYLETIRRFEWRRYMEHFEWHPL